MPPRPLLVGRSIALLSPRRRHARIPRCLRRLPKLGFQRRNTIQQRQDQPILLLRAQAGKVGTSHGKVDSYSDPQRNILLPNRRVLPPIEGALRSGVNANPVSNYEFASVVDAVRCAAEIQRGMIERDAEMPDERRIR